MKKFTNIGVLLLICFVSHAQTIRKYFIGNSGCTAYIYCDPGNFEASFNEDSSLVYSAECVAGGTTFGLITIKLSAAAGSLHNAEGSLINYLDLLKKTFEIKEAVGYEKGHRLNNDKNTRSAIDYWTGSDGQKWKVKGWTDGKFIAVLYVKGNIEVEKFKKDLFLNSFRFQGM